MMDNCTQVTLSILLADVISNDNWVEQDTVLVSCSLPSCIISSTLISHVTPQLEYHMLLDIPPANQQQIWNPVTNEYEKFDRYIIPFTHSLDSTLKYLFVYDKVDESKLRMLYRLNQVHNIQARYACLFPSVFKPDYFIKQTKDV